MAPDVLLALRRMQDFRYVWIGSPKHRRCIAPNVTHRLDFAKTMRYVSGAKVALVHNVVPVPPGRPPPILQGHPGFAPLFRAWDACANGTRTAAMHPGAGGCLRGVYMPQLKQRTMTAAAAGTVMLVYREPGTPRVIEELFTPDEHFVYFRTPEVCARAPSARPTARVGVPLPPGSAAVPPLLCSSTLSEWGCP